MSSAPADGLVAAGFERVADAFRENFAVHGDTGAACVVYADGVPVVDLWDGTTDRGPWRPETRSCVFSVSKGVTTVCVLMAVERGLLELDAPVSRYWPEYGAAGKAGTTVRDLLAHRAGLVAPDVAFTVAQVEAWHPVTAALARQRPTWVPGTRHAYHALTFGWLVGEVLRRSAGLRPGEWLQEHVAAPLGLEMAFGADPEDPDFCPMLEPLPVTDPDAAGAIAAALEEPMVRRAMSLGEVLDVTDLFGSANRPEILACEMPAANLVSNARSLARLYAAVVGEVNGIRLLSERTVRDALEVRSEGRPLVGLDEGHRWGTGFMLDSPRRVMLGPGSFGHDGAGGHLAFAHLDSGVSLAYQTCRPGGIPDDRAEALCRALQACL